MKNRQQIIHDTAVNHGFWDATPNIGEKLALIHSEISEGLEAAREHRINLESGPHNLMEELADCVIRCYDLAEFIGDDLDSIINTKMEYNAKRSYKHGKEF
jgi:NTP pyrophosphatase (non-canonical NTP hydrolase)